MYFNVSQLLRESSGATRSYRVDEPFTLAEGTKAKARGAIRLLRTDRGIWVQWGVGVGGSSLLLPVSHRPYAACSHRDRGGVLPQVGSWFGSWEYGRVADG